MISKAKKFNRLCCLTFEEKALTDAFIQAANRKIIQKLLLDRDQNRPSGSSARQQAQVNAALRAGVEVRTQSGPKTLHQKYIITDDSYLLFGSFNSTWNSKWHCHETGMGTCSPVMIETLSKNFETLWATAKPYSLEDSTKDKEEKEKRLAAKKDARAQSSREKSLSRDRSSSSSQSSRKENSAHSQATSGGAEPSL